MINFRRAELPRWVDYFLLPFLNLSVAFILASGVTILAGADPLVAFKALLFGAIGDGEAIGFTLFYTTNFIFTGLAVAMAFHARLFNIGAEGQAYLGGLGAGLVALYIGHWAFLLVFPFTVLAALLFGAAWAFIPGWLQAKRGSHIVITTIMFNFLAAALLTYLLVNVLIEPGQQAPQSRAFAESAWMPRMHEILRAIGIPIDPSPLNLSFLLALLAAFLVWVFLWRTRWGYELRAAGHSDMAALYAGISPSRVIITAMLISGALAGLVGINEVLGAQHRLMLGFAGGAGFVGIAVALMGRNHPVGIIAAAFLFGMLYQGGSEMAFDIPALQQDMVVVVQGLVILFSGALENIFSPLIERIFAKKVLPTSQPQPSSELSKQEG